MEETKTEEELSIEFKTSVIKHIHNRRELSYINHFWDMLYYSLY